ncbi:hypothetical protein BC332_12739 [Capsicum chinense]|uniref:VQ domain-containing protein n=1 Tax=Capsicum annuum TaxID=4072 RepID=A0A2G2ZGF2_CAPAN|nr:hypothetical protein T459_14019 [Capsicum annuum]PHU17044.1 hypothetical protein BC332_12739 [Capsicum chinense]
MDGPKQKEAIKVKYIDSPLLVNAKNATEFRTIVQQLTGKTPQKMASGGTIHESSSRVKLAHSNNNSNVEELLMKDLSQGINIYHYLDY